jgi:PAS domain S-box-containing protein
MDWQSLAYLVSYPVFLAISTALYICLWYTWRRRDKAWAVPMVRHLYRPQAGTILVGVLIPVAGLGVTMVGGRFPSLRALAWPVVAAVFLFASWGWFHRRRFDVAVAARDRLFEGTRDAVIVVDAQDRLVDLNTAAREAMGPTARTAIGQPVAQVFSTWPGLIEQALHADGAQIEVPLDGQEGRRHFEVSSSLLRDGRGRPAGRTIVMREVTERRQVEAALRESEERFRTIYDTAPVSIWQEDWKDVIDAIEQLHAEGVVDFPAYFRDHPGFVADMLQAVHIVDVNQWTVDMFGARHKADVLASLGIVFATADTLPGFVQELTALATGQRLFRTEMAANTVQGDTRHFLLAMSFPPRGADSGNVLVSVIDITERQEAEVRLRETQRFSEALNRINEILHASLDSGEIMQRLVDEGATALGCETAAISLRQAGRWTVTHVHGFPQSLVGTQMNDDEERHGLLALRTRQVVAIADAFEDERVNRDHMRKHNVRAVLTAPLIVRDEPFGVIFFNYHSAPQFFDEVQVHFAAQLATAAAIALENGRLFEEHNQAEKALRSSEERFRSSIENLLDAFAIYSSIRDDNGKIVDFRVEYANQVACQLTGRQHESYLGRTVLELYPDLRQTPIFDWYVEAVETGRLVVKEDFAFDTTPHGSSGIRYYDYRVARLGDGFAASWQDVTERRQAKEALHRAHDELELRVRERTAELQASEARFRQMAAAIHEVFWLLEPHSRQLLYVSPAYEKIWGRSRQPLYEQPLSFLDSLHPEDREQVQQGFTPDWQAYDGEFRILRPDGTPRWVRVRSFPIRNERGEVYRLAGTAIDLTEQKAAEAALIQAERVAIAGKLAASLVHEINNPLQAVVGCLGLAKLALENGRDPGDYVSIAHQEVQRTARIVSQLYALGRPMETRQKEPTNLNSLLSDVLVLNKKQFENKKIEVIWGPEAGLPQMRVMADPMRQVFLNLVLNAMDAMPEGGQLQVSTEGSESPAGVWIRFADTGVGISAEALPHLFEAFHSTKAQGLGIGLFVCQGIVEQHGGRIEVESRPGVGTTFTIWLPA